MKELEIEQSIGTTCESKSYRKVLPCLKMYVTVAYKEDKKIDYIRIMGTTKKDECGCSFYEAISDLLTFSIRRIRNIHEAKAIIKSMRYHKCIKVIPNKDHITSCVDAIGQVLEDALNVKEETEEAKTAQS